MGDRLVKEQQQSSAISLLYFPVSYKLDEIIRGKDRGLSSALGAITVVYFQT